MDKQKIYLVFEWIEGETEWLDTPTSEAFEAEPEATSYAASLFHGSVRPIYLNKKKAP
jgi:hypothetical protein